MSIDEDDSFWDIGALMSEVSGEVGLLLLLLLLWYAEEEVDMDEDLDGEAIILRKQWVFLKAVVAAAIMNALLWMPLFYRC